MSTWRFLFIVSLVIASVAIVEKPQISITHQQLADELGSVREVISRVLKGFEAQGVIRRGRGRIVILDMEALRKIADP